MVGHTLQISDNVQEDHAVGRAALIVRQTGDMLVAEILLHGIHLILKFNYLADRLGAVALSCLHRIFHGPDGTVKHFLQILLAHGREMDIALDLRLRQLGNVLRMIADPLQVIDRIQQVLDLLRLILHERQVGDLHQIFRQRLFHEIDQCLILINLLHRFPVIIQHSVLAEPHIFQRQLTHVNNLTLRRLNGKGRVLQDSGVQMGHDLLLRRLGLIRLLLADQLSRQCHQLSGKGEQKDRIHHIEDCMENGDLGAVDGRTCPRRIQEEDHAHHHRKQHGADHVEHQMDHSGTLCRLMGTHAGKQRRHAGTDVLSKRNINRRAPDHDTVHGQRLQDSDRRRGTLDNTGDDRTGQDSEDGIASQGCKYRCKDRCITIRLDGAGHEAQTDKQNAEADKNGADFLFPFLLRKQQHKRADSDQHRCKELRLHDLAPLAHGNQPCRDGRTDIGAHDDAHRLIQRQDPCIYKADHHNGRRRGALNDRRDQRSQKDSQKPVVGNVAQHPLHLSAGCLLESVRHDIHAVQEHSEAADKFKQQLYIAQCHNTLHISILSTFVQLPLYKIQVKSKPCICKIYVKFRAGPALNFNRVGGKI